MKRGAIGDGDTRRDLVTHPVGDGNEIAGLGHDLLAGPIAADEGDHALTGAKLDDA